MDSVNPLLKREEYFDHYTVDLWNLARLNKLVEILGDEWFEGKRILEVGCGHGKNGLALKQLGSDVVFTDGRQFFVDFLKNDGHEAYVVDHDNPWTVPGEFDLVVHWGLMYHLNNWKQDLQCALDHAPMLCLETEVADVADPRFEFKMDEPDVYDQAMNHVGTIVSANCLETYVTSLGASHMRYDSVDLNVDATHYYDWPDTNSGFFRQGQRRYWLIRRVQ
jgi:SAM-dependent methyltransferase